MKDLPKLATTRQNVCVRNVSPNVCGPVSRNSTSYGKKSTPSQSSQKGPLQHKSLQVSHLKTRESLKKIVLGLCFLPTWSVTILSPLLDVENSQHQILRTLCLSSLMPLTYKVASGNTLDVCGTCCSVPGAHAWPNEGFLQTKV